MSSVPIQMRQRTANSKTTLLGFLTGSVIIAAMVTTTITSPNLLLGQASASSLLTDRRHQVETITEIPIAASGDNVYVTWWTNKSGNNEVMFRVSNDNGATFGDKINLSNTTGAESIDANVEALDDSVYVTWWERNQTDNEPVMKLSNDNGETFGPLLKLANNGTIVQEEEEGEEEG
jgi:hypothetical protein